MPFVLNAELNLQLSKGGSTIGQQILNQLKNINAKIDVKVSEAGKASINQLSRSLNSLENTIKSLNGELNKSYSSIDKYTNSLNKAAAAGKTATANIGSSAGAIKTVGKEFIEAGDAATNFGHQIGLAGKRFAAFVAATGGFFALVGAIKSGVSEAIKFDLAINKLTQVADDGSKGVGLLRQTVQDLSRSLGVSSLELADAAGSFTQAGLKARDAAVAVEAFSLSLLSPNFGNAKQTIEGMIALYQQFGHEVGNLKNQLGSINAVAGAFASEASDLIVAVQKAGGVFATTGGKLEELLGLMTAIRATTRESAETIATGLRSIFTYVQRTDTIDHLKQLGIQLRYTEQQARALGNIDLTDQFVGPYQAVQRLSEGLAGLRRTDPRYAQIVEDLGGVRQVSRVLPLIQQFGEAQKAVNVARIGGASLEAAAAVRQDAIATKLQKTKEIFQQLTNDLVENKGFKAFIDGVGKTASVIADLIRVMGPLLPIIAGFGIAKAVSFGSKAAVGALTPSNFVPATIKRATGGWVPGHGSGDTVPMLAEPGEYVINKRAARKLGGSKLNRLNGYAEGGSFEGTSGSSINGIPVFGNLSQESRELLEAHSSGLITSIRSRKNPRITYPRYEGLRGVPEVFPVYSNHFNKGSQVNFTDPRVDDDNIMSSLLDRMDKDSKKLYGKDTAGRLVLSRVSRDRSSLADTFRRASSSTLDKIIPAGTTVPDDRFTGTTLPNTGENLALDSRSNLRPGLIYPDHDVRLMQINELAANDENFNQIINNNLKRLNRQSLVHNFGKLIKSDTGSTDFRTRNHVALMKGFQEGDLNAGLIAGDELQDSGFHAHGQLLTHLIQEGRKYGRYADGGLFNNNNSQVQEVLYKIQSLGINPNKLASSINLNSKIDGVAGTFDRDDKKIDINTDLIHSYYGNNFKNTNREVKGTLSHEFGHGLDSILGTKEFISPLGSKSILERSNYDPELQEILKRINDEKKSYRNTNPEKFAEAFGNLVSPGSKINRLIPEHIQGGLYSYIRRIIAIERPDLKSKFFARGGPVFGGTPGEDSVNAKLMPGEYVLRKHAVDQLGVDRVAHMNRTGKLPGFAEGGPFEGLSKGYKDISATAYTKLSAGYAKDFTAGLNPAAQLDKVSLKLKKLFGDIDNIFKKLTDLAYSTADSANSKLDKIGYAGKKIDATDAALVGLVKGVGTFKPGSTKNYSLEQQIAAKVVEATKQTIIDKSNLGRVQLSTETLAVIKQAGGKLNKNEQNQDGINFLKNLFLDPRINKEKTAEKYHISTAEGGTLDRILRGETGPLPQLIARKTKSYSFHENQGESASSTRGGAKGSGSELQNVLNDLTGNQVRDTGGLKGDKGIEHNFNESSSGKSKVDILREKIAAQNLKEQEQKRLASERDNILEAEKIARDASKQSTGGNIKPQQSLKDILAARKAAAEAEQLGHNIPSKLSGKLSDSDIIGHEIPRSLGGSGRPPIIPPVATSGGPSGYPDDNDNNNTFYDQFRNKQIFQNKILRDQLIDGRATGPSSNLGSIKQPYNRKGDGFFGFSISPEQAFQTQQLKDAQSKYGPDYGSQGTSHTDATQAAIAAAALGKLQQEMKEWITREQDLRRRGPITRDKIIARGIDEYGSTYDYDKEARRAAGRRIGGGPVVPIGTIPSSGPDINARNLDTLHPTKMGLSLNGQPNSAFGLDLNASNSGGFEFPPVGPNAFRQHPRGQNVQSTFSGFADYANLRANALQSDLGIQSTSNFGSSKVSKPTFSYEALNLKGDLVKGNAHAETREELIKQLAKEGHFVTDVKQVSTGSSKYPNGRTGNDILATTNVGATIAQNEVNKAQQELARGINRQLQVLNPLLTSHQRLAAAEELATQAYRDNSAVVRNSTGRITGLQSLQTVGGGTGQGGRFSQFADNLRYGDNVFKRGAGKILGGIGSSGSLGAVLAASTGAQLLSEAVIPTPGSAVNVVRGGNENGYTVRTAAGGALSGAAIGAGVGLALGGPWGAAIGGVIGGLNGLREGFKKAAQDLNDAKLSNALEGLGDRLRSVGSGKNPLSSLDQNLVIKDLDQIKASAEFKAAESTSSFFGRDAKAYDAASTSEVRKALTNQAGTFAAVLSEELTRLVKNRPDASIEQIFKEFNGGTRGRLLKTVNEDIRQLSPAESKKETLSDIRDAQNNQISIKAIEKGNTEQNKLITSLGQLSLAVTNAAHAAESFKTSMDVVFGGSASTSGLTGGLSQIGSQGPEFAQSVGGISNFLGSNGVDFKKSALAIDSVQKVLPSILAQVSSQGFDEHNTYESKVTSGLNKQLDGNDPYISSIISVVRRGLAEESNKNAGNSLKRVSNGDTTGFVKDLLSGPTSIVLSEGEKLAKSFQDIFNSVISSLSTFNKKEEEALSQKARGFDLSLNTTRANADFAHGGDGGRSLSYAQLVQPFQARQQQLLQGFGIGGEDASGISTRLAQTNLAKEAANSKLNSSVLAGDELGAKKAANDFSRLDSEANRLERALKNLIDPTQKLAAIQERLAHLNEDRESRLGFAERFENADPDEKGKIIRGQALAKKLAEDQSGFKNLSQDDRRLALRESSSIGGAQFSNGLTGNKLKELLLGQSGVLNPANEKERKDLLEEKAKTAQNAETANTGLSTILETQNQKFLDLLNKSYDKFFSRLEINLLKTEVSKARAAANDKDSELGPLNSLVKSKNILNAAGIRTDDQLRVAKNSGKDLDAFITASSKLKSLNRTPLSNIQNSVSNNIGAIQAETGFTSNTDSRIAAIKKAVEESGVAKEISGQVALYVENNSRTLSSNSLRGNKGAENLISLIQKGEGKYLRGPQENADSEVRKTEKTLSDSGITVGNLDPEKIKSALEAFKTSGTSLQDLQKNIDKNRESFNGLNKAAEELAGRLNLVQKQESIRDIPKNIPPTIDLDAPHGRNPAGLPNPPPAGSGWEVRGFAKGGSVFRPDGTDVVPAMLSHGEFVVNSTSAKANMGLLHDINNAKGPVGGIADIRDYNREPSPQNNLFDKSNPTNSLGMGGPVYLAEGGFAGIVDRFKGSIKKKSLIGVAPNSEFGLEDTVKGFGDQGRALIGKDKLNPADNGLSNFIGDKLTQFNAKRQIGAALFQQALEGTGDDIYQSGISRVGKTESKDFERFRQRFGSTFKQLAQSNAEIAINKRNNRNGLAGRGKGAKFGDFDQFGPGEAGRAKVGPKNGLFDEWNGQPNTKTNSDPFRQEGEFKGFSKFATGGIVTGGIPGQDSVPALLTPGERVIPQNKSVPQGASDGMAKMAEQSAKLGTALGGFSEPAGKLSIALMGFGERSEALAQALDRFPREVSHNGTFDVNVNMNGAEVLSEVSKGLQTMIDSSVSKSLNQELNKRFPEASAKLSSEGGNSLK